MTDEENERRVIDRLFWIAVLAIAGAVAVAFAAHGDVSTALLVIGTNCVTALGVRRTRTQPPPASDGPTLADVITAHDQEGR